MSGTSDPCEAYLTVLGPSVRDDGGEQLRGEPTLQMVHGCLGNMTWQLGNLSIVVASASRPGMFDVSGDEVAEPLVVAAALSATFAVSLALLLGILLRQCRWRRPIIFLSYRVHSDQPLVEALYTRLRAHGLRVWWDRECLKPGQEWEEGFATGLFSAAIFVPVLSKAALADFASLEADSKCDNVLLE